MAASRRNRWLAGAASIIAAAALSVPGTAPVAAEPATGDVPASTGAENGPATLRSDVRAPRHDYRVLVFTKTDGERRPSIKDGVATIKELAAANGFEVTS